MDPLCPAISEVDVVRRQEQRDSARVQSVENGEQFAARRDKGACESCHDDLAFVPASKFNHDRDAAFKLEGAHAKTPCASCHVPQPGADGKPFVTYKPTPTKCEACHVTGIPAAGTKRSSLVPASGPGTLMAYAAHEVRHARR